jgi:phosphoglycolate phosphatase
LPARHRPAGGPAGEPIRAVAIDLDGTLLDTIGELAAAVNAMLERLERAAATGQTRQQAPGATLRLAALPGAAVRNMVGKGMANLVHRSLAAAMGEEPSPELAAHALTVYQECYFALLGTTTGPYPGVMAGLDRMRDMGLPLACVTNKAERFTLPLLERTGMLDRFALVVCGDTLRERKPHPLPLLKTADHFGCAPHELLMIGDSVNDVSAARAAGCPVLCVPYGYNEGEPVDKLDFDDMIGDLSEACDWIERRSMRGAATPRP